MNIKATITIINEMQKDRVIGRYAIGGAVAATVYMEPIDTADLDIFMAIGSGDEAVITLSPIYAYLRTRGFRLNQEGNVVIAGWPVQFLPVCGDPLLEEALEQSLERDIDGVSTRVFSPEHLAAVALQVGRPKDKQRLTQFLEFRAFNATAFSAILERHGLVEVWSRFKRQMEL